jgi:hypothetical protein
MRCPSSLACRVFALAALVDACSTKGSSPATGSVTAGSSGFASGSEASNSASASPSGARGGSGGTAVDSTSGGLSESSGGSLNGGGGALGDAEAATGNVASGHAEGGAGDAADASVEASSHTLTLLDDARIGSDPSQPNYRMATAPVKLAGGPFASVTLVVDLTSTCYPFSNWATDKPPAGQNWPADCDAFDRNFEMALFDPVSKASPGIELVRAITPFGGPEHIERDVTDAFNAIGSTARAFTITIPTASDSTGIESGSDGGWNVSAHLEVTPGTPPRNLLSVQSLIYTSIPASESGMTTSLPFTLPAGTTATTIEYRVTGHGDATDSSSNCIGPADEFCKRVHTLTLDGTLLDSIAPWRGNCSTVCTIATSDASSGPVGGYCAQNPCGDIQSVEAPRANWCPGSETPPFVYKPSLSPGDHTFAFAISSIAGFWRVSTTVYAYGD